MTSVVPVLPPPLVVPVHDCYTPSLAASACCAGAVTGSLLFFDEETFLPEVDYYGIEKTETETGSPLSWW